MRTLFLFASIFLSQILFAQEPFYWQITGEDGLPSMTVYNIEQDQKGFIWIGTAGGLCRYDGRKFEYYRHPDQLDDEIIHLKIDKLDWVWYSNLAGQLFCKKEGEEVEIVWDGASNNELRLIDFYLVNSTVIITCDLYPRKGNIVFCFDLNNDGIIPPKEEWKRISTGEKRVIPVKEVENDKVVIAYSESSTLTLLIIVKSKDLNAETLGYYLNDYTPDISMTYQGGKWRDLFFIDDKIITTGAKVLIQHQISTGKETFIQISNIINTVKKIDNQLWLTSLNGGLKIYDQNIQLLDHYFSNTTINSCVQDREKNIWLASNKGGIFVIPNKRKAFFNKENSSLTFNEVNFFQPDFLNKKMIVGGESGTIHSFFDNKIEPAFEFENSPHFTIGGKSNDNTWLFGNQSGIFLIEQAKRTFIPKQVFKTFHIDKLNNFWGGSYNSTIKIDLNNIQKITTNHLNSIDTTYTILNERTFAIHEDEFDDYTWLGSYRGLFRYSHQTNKVKPFLENGIHQKYRFSSIVQSSRDSTIWAGTHGDGVLKIKDGKLIEHYTTENHLISNICNGLFADKFGNIWIGTNQGLQKHNLKTENFELINKYDGLPTNEIANVSVLDSTVYVGTNKGVVTFSINSENLNKIPPPIYIQKVLIFEKDTALSESYRLDYDQNSIQINFVGLGYKCKGNILYKYRMLGIDSNWISTDVRFARFPGLVPRNYEFQVIAINEDGIESEEQATVKFKISPPFWQTWWFRILTLLLGGGIVWGFFHTRYRRIRNREKMKRDFKDQVNELRAQALQTQMNPHFIFNSLNAIQHFLTTNDQENAMIYMARFAKLIRHIFEHSKEKNITLTQEFEFLNLYISLEKLRFKDKVNVDFRVDKNLVRQAEALEIPPLLIQPIVENSFKHGLFHKETQGNLVVNFSFEKGVLKIIIEDDGIGREKSEEINSWRKGNHKSSGVNSTRERILLLNKEDNSALNDLKIIDLFNSKGEAIGTRVEINLVPRLID